LQTRDEIYVSKSVKFRKTKKKILNIRRNVLLYLFTTEVTTVAVCLVGNCSCMHIIVIRPINCTHKFIQHYSLK